MNDLTSAWYNLFESIYNNFVEPLANALYQTSLIEEPVNLLNQLINALLNLFREEPVSDLIYIGLDDIANLFGILILIIIINYYIKLLKFVIESLKVALINITNNKKRKVWRKQWKKKEIL